MPTETPPTFDAALPGLFDEEERPSRRPTGNELLAGLNPAQREAVAHERRPAADLRRRRIGQDPGAHPPHRLAHHRAGHRARSRSSPSPSPTRRPTRCASRVGALVGPVARRMWVSTFHSACVRILRREADRLGYRSSFTIYDEADAVAPDRLRPARPQPRQQAVPAAVDPRHHLGRQERAARLRGLRRPGAEPSTSGGSPRSTREYQRRLLAASAMDFDDLLLRHRQPVPGQHPTCWRATSTASSTSWSTSTRTPTGPRTSWSLLLGREHRNICVVGDSDQSRLPVPGRRHPQHPRVRGGLPRRHDHRARAELPLDPDDPRRRQRGHRQQRRAQAEGAVDRAGRRRADHPLPRRGRARRGAAWRRPDRDRPAASSRRRRCRGATSPSSTGPTPRAGRSRRSSSGAASRTGSSAARGSTTAARSRTSSPTCGRWPTRPTRCR